MLLLSLDDIRVVHVCCGEIYLNFLHSRVCPTVGLHWHYYRSQLPNTHWSKAVEETLKGPGANLPEGLTFMNKYGPDIKAGFTGEETLTPTPTIF